MSIFPNLKRPPILEALIDCRFIAAESFSLQKLREKVAALRSSEEVMEERRQFEAEFSIAADGGGATKQPHSVLTAMVLRNTASGLVRQFRRDGFTVSLVKNYERWEVLQDEARSVFALFEEWSCPIAVSRVATRFINLLALPEGRSDLDDILVSGPKIPGSRFDHVRDFSYRTVMGTNDERVTGILSVGTYSAGPGQSAGILVDVDAFNVETLPVNFEAVAEVLTRLRDLKNSMFFLISAEPQPIVA